MFTGDVLVGPLWAAIFGPPKTYVYKPPMIGESINTYTHKFTEWPHSRVLHKEEQCPNWLAGVLFAASILVCVAIL